MAFRSPILAGTTLVRPAIQSSNFSAGHAGWQIAASGTAEFNNVVIRGGSTVGGTILEYSGTPAAGNLVASISAAAGVDAYGNHYAAGILAYDQVNFLFAQLANGTVSVGALSGGAGSAPDTADAAALNGTAAGISQLTSGTAAATAFTDAATVQLNAGKPGKPSGSGVNPYIAIRDTAGTSAVDVVLYGALLAGIPGVGQATWQTPGVAGAPSYAADWGPSGTFIGFGGGPGLRYHHMAENDVWLYGLATCTAGAAGTVTTLAAGYFSTLHTSYGTVLRNRGGTLAAVAMAVDTGGNVMLSSGPAAGDEYLFNLRLPLELVP